MGTGARDSGSRAPALFASAWTSALRRVPHGVQAERVAYWFIVAAIARGILGVAGIL